MPKSRRCAEYLLSPILMQFPESYAYEMPATQLTI